MKWRQYPSALDATLPQGKIFRDEWVAGRGTLFPAASRLRRMFLPFPQAGMTFLMTPGMTDAARTLHFSDPAPHVGAFGNDDFVIDRDGLTVFPY